MSYPPTLMAEPGWAKEWELHPVQDSTYKPASSARLARRVPMWLFVAGDGRRVLSSRPVDVEVSEEGPDNESSHTAVVLSCPRLHVFAAGAEYKAAEDDFHDQVVHFYHMYSSMDANALDADSAEIKSLYDLYFEESLPPA